MRLLLGSGGFSTEERKKGWVDAVTDFLSGIDSCLFVPYALADHDRYTSIIEERGFHGPVRTEGLHRAPDPGAAVAQAECVSVGGGNSFRLIHDLHSHDLIAPIRARVEAGMPYLGVSAGTNVACPTIMTTNDMPIVQPPSFTALDLIPFQINPHFFGGTLYHEVGGEMIPYGGETREDRLREYHEMNDRPILGLHEGAILRIEGAEARLCGVGDATLFVKGEERRELVSGDDVSFLLDGRKDRTETG